MTAPVMDTSSGPGSVHRSTLRTAVVDAVVVLVWFAMAGVVGGVVWWQVTSLPKITRAGDSASQAPDQLVNQVGIDGWFFVVALAGGLLSGIVLLAWRRRDPLLMILLVALGGGLAAWVTVRTGLALGPSPELAALRDLAEGDKVSMQLKLHAPGIALVWPIAALVGALLQLWVLAKPEQDQT
jgi:hypothetical protein